MSHSNLYRFPTSQRMRNTYLIYYKEERNGRK